jgi:lipopolysaccharide/colanic/teichoic acid biosynthesis glycosyltransferase
MVVARSAPRHLDARARRADDGGHRLQDVTRTIRPIPRSLFQRVAKRTIDIVGASVTLAVCSPLFVGIAAAVRLSSAGPALFVQPRMGLNGRRFQFYKFRTMVADAEERKAELAHLNEIKGPAFKIQRDPRIHKLGALLRKSSLDELPQLWNVIKGDMSLVGPRPPCVEEVARYNERQVQRLAVIPGITGLWQVSGRNEIQDFEKWIDLDIEYAQTWSIRKDLEILWKTIGVVISARGAQ